MNSVIAGYEPIESCGYNLRNCTSRRTISDPSHFPSRSSTGGKVSQGHSFVTKTAPLNERCYPCEKVFVPCKQALKCNNCKMMCHPHCKDKCPMPCIHWTPCSTKGPESTISDFTSSTSSMIPSLIIHCVNEIESRGLKDIGLYLIPAVGKEMKEVKEKLLKGKNLIKLNKTYIHVLCGVITSFLRSLKEPLIPTSAWKSFMKAAELKDKNTSLYLLYNLVCDLPQPNKETLAFLLQHFQRVSKSTDCLMSVEHLAKVLSSTIVGNSAPDLSSAKMMQELFRQRTVLERLLMLPSVCWPVILDRHLSANCQQFSVLAAIKASESSLASNSSRNKPVSATVQKDHLPLAR